jgi:hypothetical protein
MALLSVRARVRFGTWSAADTASSRESVCRQYPSTPRRQDFDALGDGPATASTGYADRDQKQHDGDKSCPGQLGAASIYYPTTNPLHRMFHVRMRARRHRVRYKNFMSRSLDNSPSRSISGPNSSQWPRRATWFKDDGTCECAFARLLSAE